MSGFFDALKSDYGVDIGGIRSYGAKSITSMWDSITKGTKKVATRVGKSLESKGFLSSIGMEPDEVKVPEPVSGTYEKVEVGGDFDFPGDPGVEVDDIETRIHELDAPETIQAPEGMAEDPFEGDLRITEARDVPKIGETDYPSDLAVREDQIVNDMRGETLGIEMDELPAKYQNSEWLDKVELNWEEIVTPREARANNITIDDLSGTNVTPAELTLYHDIEKTAPEVIEMMQKNDSHRNVPFF